MDRPRRIDCTAGQMDGEACWWTTSGNIRIPPLAKVVGVGRQQQQHVAFAVAVAMAGMLAVVVEVGRRRWWWWHQWP